MKYENANMDYELAKHRETPLWKGEGASHSAKHQYLRLHFGKADHCENPDCKYPRKNAARRWLLAPKSFEWALRKGRSYTHNKEDYWMLCGSCHKKYDGSGNNTKKRYGLSIG